MHGRTTCRLRDVRLLTARDRISNMDRLRAIDELIEMKDSGDVFCGNNRVSRYLTVLTHDGCLTMSYDLSSHPSTHRGTDPDIIRYRQEM